MILRPRQAEFVDRCHEALLEHGNTLGIAPTGAGKCLGRGTPVLMYDGTIKPVEEVAVGDVLIGPNSGPRLVTSTTMGIGPLFRVTPKKGDPYIVNDAHILSLKITPGATKHNCSISDNYQSGKIHNIPVHEYLNKSKTFKHCAKGWRTGVTWTQEISQKQFPPYLLGVWIGDGLSGSPAICTMDNEVSKEWCSWITSLGLSVRKEFQKGNKAVVFHATTGIKGNRLNFVRNLLRDMDLLGDKHFPLRYLISSRRDRLELLAGIIDSDGSLSRGGYDVIFKSKKLAEKTAFLSRSLGFAAYISECKKTCANNGVEGSYFRISISGDCVQIPVRIPRKKCGVRKINKDPLVTGISVEPVGIGEYYGFEITGDRLFLLGDFTVTHNTVMFCSEIARFQNALVLQHRDELVTQNFNTYKKIKPNGYADIYTADRKRFCRSGATFAMIQTLSRPANLDRMQPVDIIAIDESHHSAANGYQAVINRCREINPDVKIFGVTATPGRSDKKALSTFTNIADVISLAELIQAGHLVRPRTFVIECGIREDLNRVKVTAADFDMGEVEKIMDKMAINQKVVSEWLSKAGDRPTVIFCSTVDHARHVTEAFVAAGVRAEIIYGDMRDGDRKDTLKRLETRETQVVVNVAVLTEGFDCQIISCVCLLRPCSHKSTMLQMIGRGLRKVDPMIFPGVIKDDCVILDFGYSILTHGNLDIDAQLAPKKRAKGPIACPQCHTLFPSDQDECPSCGAIVIREKGQGGGPRLERGDLEEFVLTEVELLEVSPFRWCDMYRDGTVTMANAMTAWACCVGLPGGRWIAIGALDDEPRLAPGHILSNSPSRIQAISSSDDFLREFGDKVGARKTQGWLSTPASDKQLAMLGLDPVSAFGINRYEASCQITWNLNQKKIQTACRVAINGS